GYPCHLVEHGEAAVDLLAGGTVLLDGAGQVLAEPAVEEIIVVTHVKAGFGEKVREILLEILSDTQQAGSRVFVLGRFAGGLHLSRHTSGGPDNQFFWASRAAPHPATR